tara:strand:+ start:161 stop:403 length:243 start_codon:yes stop_codon:yes gene_type:complete
MKNKDSSYLAIDISMIGLLIVILILLLTSCSGYKHLSTTEHQQLNKLDYELSKLWDKYEYESDSLLLEQDKIINKHKINK